MINIALSDLNTGDAIDAKFTASLQKELKDLALEKNFVIYTTNCENGFFTININTSDPIDLGDQLIPWLRMMKLKAGSHVNASFTNGQFVELKRADISRQAETFENQ